MKKTIKLLSLIALAFLIGCSSDDNLNFNSDWPNGGYPDNGQTTYNKYDIDINLEGYVSVGSIDYGQRNSTEPPKDGPRYTYDQTYVEEHLSKTYQLTDEEDYVYLSFYLWDNIMALPPGQNLPPLHLKYSVKRNDTIVTQVDTILSSHYGKGYYYY